MLNWIRRIVNRKLNHYQELAALRARKISELCTYVDELEEKLGDSRCDALWWKRRYDRLTGKSGRTIAELKSKIAEQEEDTERLLLDIRRLHNEVADRAEVHIRTREENASLLMELVTVKRELAACKESMGEVDRLKDENYALWCENGLLKTTVALMEKKEVE